MPAAIACPKCRSKMKSANPAPGRKIRCPKCGSAFSIPAGAPGGEDPYADDDPYASSPRASRRSGGRRRRKSGPSLKLPLIILGVAVVLVGAGLGIALVVKNLPGDLADTLDLSNLAADVGIGGDIDFTYMPAGTTQIGVMRPRAYWISGIAEEMRDPDEAAAQLARFEERFGFPMTEMESFTLFMGGPAGDVQVVELATAVDPQAVTSRLPGVEPVQHGSTTYYRLGESQAGRALHFVSGTTILVASEAVVTSVIDGTFAPGDSSAFSFVDGSSHVLDATVQIERDKLWMELNDHAVLNLADPGGRFDDLHGDNIIAASGGRRMSGSCEVRAAIRFSSDESAEEAREWIEQAIAEQQEQVAGSLASIDERLEAAREAEREREEQAQRGENPFGGNIRRVSDVEEERRNEQHRSALLDASSVSRRGSVLTLETRYSAEDLAHEESLLEAITESRVVSQVSAVLGWAPAGDDEIVVTAPATSPASTGGTGNEQPVFQFTYNIMRYARPDTSALEQDVEAALLRVSSYVPESASVDIVQARISFQVTNDFQITDAVIQLQRAGLFLEGAPAEEEELMREVPQRVAENTRLEFDIVSIRPGSDRTARADQALQVAPGYVAGSVVVDEEANRLTAEFSGRANPAQIMTILRGAGLVVEPAGSNMAGRPPSGPVYISLYYESYGGDKPVGEAVREMVEGLNGYVEGSLQHDEAAGYVTFQMEGRRPETSARRALFDAGFQSHSMSTGSEPTPVEELRESLRRGQRQ